MSRPAAPTIVVLLGLLLAACAGKPTPYQAAQGGYGYSEQRLEDNRYRVSFAGIDATGRVDVDPIGGATSTTAPTQLAIFARSEEGR